jgi:3-hydroxyacyl-CoA dehydrogenase
MNPVPVMKLVEVIPGLATSETTLRRTLALAEAMGKTTATSRDVPGFIANRLLMPYINEAVIALSEVAACPPAPKRHRERERDGQTRIHAKAADDARA